jgi:energy-coupling factor transport system permease protein
MASYDALRHVAIGQYIAVESPLHRLDARAKLLATLGLFIAIIIASHYATNVAMLLLILLGLKCAALSTRYILRNIAPALPLVFLIALLQFLFYGASQAPDAGDALWISWGIIRISGASLRIAVVLILRFSNMLLLTSLLMSTTSSEALMRGLEGLMRPLDRIGLPGHELALVGAVALRFLPILGEQLEAIIKAQASRGVELADQNRWRMIRNAQRLAALIVPLFVDAFRRAEEMSLAMQARCYRGGRGRTHLSTLSWSLADSVILGVGLCAIILVVVLQTLPNLP